MEDSELSRRKVLSGLAVTGAAGGLVSGGTASLLSESEEFGNSEFTAGIVDLGVDWELDDESGSSEGDATIPIEITEENTSGQANLTVSVTDESNPVYAWLRTRCPRPSADFVDDLFVTLRYADGTIIAEGTLLSVAENLQSGVELDGDSNTSERECLDVGEPIDLVFEWSLPESETYTREGVTTVDFEFVGRQCRHNDGTVNPFPSDPPECEEPDEPEGKSISFVAFCTDGVVENPSEDSTDYIDHVVYSGEGEPIEVEWSTDVDVNYVIVKGGNPDNYETQGGCMTIYDYTGIEKTSGTVTYLDEGKYVEETCYDAPNGAQSIPCAVAERVVGSDSEDDDVYDGGTQIKIEYDDGGA